ncbi:MAG: hypothetical protein WCJ64_05105 [Rhodospirillaceae bacterium]
MLRRIPPLVAALAFLAAGQALAAPSDPFFDMLFRCEGSGAVIEIFAATVSAQSRVEEPFVGGRSAIIHGFYAFDLTSAGRGKSLSPVRLQTLPNGKAVIVTFADNRQDPVSIPVKGGIVTFDPKWAPDTKCHAAGWHGEDN